MLPQTSKVEIEVNNILSNQYVFAGGRVRNFVSKWKELTSDPQILDIISHCHIEFGEIPSQKRWSAVTNLEDKFSDQEKATIDAQIAEFLSKGIVSYSVSQVGQIISPIFLRRKSDGTYRPIFNLKALNDNVVYHHFKLDTLEATLPLVTPVCYMTSLDLKVLFHSHRPRTATFFEVYVERHPLSIFVSPYGFDIGSPNIYKSSKTRLRLFERTMWNLVCRLY